MEVDVEAFRGTADDFSLFVTRQWLQAYRGTMNCPLWPAEYFRWQLGEVDGTIAGSVAAYCGGSCIGTAASFPLDFVVDNQRVKAAQGSWLSVRSDMKRQGVAKKIQRAFREQMLNAGQRFRVGYAFFGHRTSAGPRFWLRPRSTTGAVRRVGFWVRVLDAAGAAAWNLQNSEALMTRFASPLLWLAKPRPLTGGVVRNVETRDISQCLELAEDATKHCSIRILWTKGSIGRLLGLETMGYGKAKVLERRGKVKGLIAWHLLPILGREAKPVAVIDLVFVSQLTHSERQTLLNTVLADQKAEGAVVAMKLRTGDYPRGMFLHRGWFCRAADSHMLLSFPDQRMQISGVRQVHVLWR